MKVSKKNKIIVITCLCFVVIITLTLFTTTRCFDCSPNITKRGLTELALRMLASRVSMFHLIKVRLPESIEEIARCTLDDNSSCNIVDSANFNDRDAWNNPIIYKKLSDSKFSLTSYGADGIKGGTGLDVDITIIP